MKKILLGIIPLLLFSISCSGNTVWVRKDRPTAEQRQKDLNECKVQAHLTSSYHHGFFGSYVYYDALDDCLKSRGYMEMSRKEAIELGLMNP